VFFFAGFVNFKELYHDAASFNVKRYTILSKLNRVSLVLRVGSPVVNVKLSLYAAALNV
jgi:hypothetical protein